MGLYISIHFCILYVDIKGSQTDSGIQIGLEPNSVTGTIFYFILSLHFRILYLGFQGSQADSGR
jgi:preprotein translocase subunit SecY